MNITEVKNKHNMKGGKIKMTCDDNGLNVPPPLQRSNFFYVIAGAPGSGKTNLLLSLVSKRGKFYYKQFHKIYLFSNSMHTIKKRLDLPKDQLIHGFDEMSLQKVLEKEQHEFDNLEEDECPNKILVIFDDVVSQIQRNMKGLLKLAYNRRHISGGLSIILTTQKLNKVPLELRTAISGLFAFDSKNKQEMEALWKEYITLSRDEFQKVLKFVFDKPHNFLFLNLEMPASKMMFKNFDQLVVEC